MHILKGAKYKNFKIGTYIKCATPKIHQNVFTKKIFNYIYKIINLS